MILRVYDSTSCGCLPQVLHLDSPTDREQVCRITLFFLATFLQGRAKAEINTLLGALQWLSVLPPITWLYKHQRQKSPKLIFWVCCGMFMD